MFLKVIHNGKTKKLKFSEELQEYDAFLNTIMTISGIELENIRMTFVDNELEVLPINDRLDFDYFLADVNNNKFKEIKVERKENLSTPTNTTEEKILTAEPITINLEEELAKETVKESAEFECPFLNWKKEFSKQLSVESVHVEENKPEEKKPFVHSHVTCDSCHTQGIVGKRFKCMQCFNFDICETCESENKHSHHLLIRCNESIPERLVEKLCNKFNRKLEKIQSIECKNKDKKCKNKDKECPFGKFRPHKGQRLSRNIGNFVNESIKILAPLFNGSKNTKTESEKDIPVKVEKVVSESVNVEPVKTEPVKVDEVKKEIEQLQKEKKDLLFFIFGDAQLPLIETLFKRFEHLNIEEMFNEIRKCNEIIDSQNLL